MSLRKRHKVPKKIAAPAKTLSQDTASLTNSLPMKAEHLLDDAKNVQLLEDVLSQINEFYDVAWNNGREVLPIFVGITPGGTLVELSGVRLKAEAGDPLQAKDLTVFTYEIGKELSQNIEPRQIAEVNMVRGQEQIRLQSSENPMPTDGGGGKDTAKWRFIDAETIQIRTMGIYELQPENYDALSFGHGIKDLGGTEDSIIPLQHFAAEIK